MLSKDSSAKEITPIAMAVHELLRLPITMRSLNKKGVRIEDGKVLDDDYTGPVLDQVLQENHTIRTIPKSGAYSEIPVVVSPIRDDEGSVIAAIGVVDTIGTINIGAEFGEKYLSLVKKMQTR